MQAIILNVISTSRGLPCKLYYSMMSFLHSGGSRQAIILDVISTSRGLPCKLYYSMMSFLHSGGSRQAIILDVISASRGLPCKLLHSMLSFLQAGWTCHASGTVTMQLSMMHEYSIKTVCRNHSIQVAMCIYRAELYIALCDSWN